MIFYLKIPFHTDCAQSIGKVPVSVKELKVTMLTMAGHKFYTPKGIGVLYIKEDFIIKPLLIGASQEKGLRPGTENTPYIVGLGKACEIISEDLPLIQQHLQNVTEPLLNGLLDNPRVKLNGAYLPRLPNTFNISIKGVIADEFIEKIGDKVALSAGSACHSGVRKPSHVLLSMGLKEEDAISSIRISTGKFTTLSEVNEARNIILNMIN